MDPKVHCFVLLAVLVLGSNSQHNSDDDDRACQLWRDMASELSGQRSSEMTCYANSTNPCTSLHCTGTYKYMSSILTSNGVEVDYCFGMTLNHCDNPVSIDVYLQVPAKNVTYIKRVSHNTQLQVPGLSFSYNNVGKIDVFLYFHMIRKGNKLSLSITCKLRISSALGYYWPDRLQKVLVPEEEIPVPACPGNHGTSPPPVIRGCSPPHWVPLPASKTPTSSPVVTPIPKSHTYGKPCSPGVEVCGRWEMCSTLLNCTCDIDYSFIEGRCTSPTRFGSHCLHDTDCNSNGYEVCTASKCACAAGYWFDSYYQLCKMTYNPRGNGDSTKKTKTSEHKMPHEPDSGKTPDRRNKLAIIAGSVTGAIVLLIVILAIIFFVRKRQQPYSNRELLLAPSDDSDVVI